MIPSILLSALILIGLAAAAVYFLAIKPGHMIEQWAAGLSNGGHFPKKPVVKGYYWLLPIHRELLAVCDKMDDLKQKVEEVQALRTEDDFLKHCILASLMEGILVVDGQGVITLVNAEFINMFQLTQSPLQRTISEVVRDKKLNDLVAEALRTGRVQSARITRQITAEVGRPPTLEVSAVPIRVQKDRVHGVIVLFLPPPDRNRILQSMKRHSQRLDNLVSELFFTGVDGEKAAVLKKEQVDLRDLFEEVLSVFASRAENSGIKTDWQVPDTLSAVPADSSCLQVALVHLLANLCSELGAVTGVSMTAESDAGWLSIRVLFSGSSMTDEDLQRVLEAPFRRQAAQTTPIIGSSGLGLVREIMGLHGGHLEAFPLEGQTVAVLKLPLVTETADRSSL